MGFFVYARRIPDKGRRLHHRPFSFRNNYYQTLQRFSGAMGCPVLQ